MLAEEIGNHGLSEGWSGLGRLMVERRWRGVVGVVVKMGKMSPLGGCVQLAGALL